MPAPHNNNKKKTKQAQEKKQAQEAVVVTNPLRDVDKIEINPISPDDNKSTMIIPIIPLPMTPSDPLSTVVDSIAAVQLDNIPVAGLQQKTKLLSSTGGNFKSLTNFGFIPKKKSRPVSEQSLQINNLILDPEQSTPVNIQVISKTNSDELIDKEVNHNPKSELGRKRKVTDNNSTERREYTNEQSTPLMVNTVITTYPTIFSAVGPRKNQLNCDICFKILKSAKMSHILEHLKTNLHMS